MNYFNRNRGITIVLIALMIINVTAIVTIAVKGGMSREKREWKPGAEQRDRSVDRERGWREGRTGREFSRRFRERLDLTEDQQEKMNQLWEQNRSRMDVLKHKMDSTQELLNSALGSRELDKDLISSLNGEIVSLDGQIRENLFEFNLQVRKLLDDNQLDKYLDMHKEMRRRGQRRGQINMIQNF